MEAETMIISFQIQLNHPLNQQHQKSLFYTNIAGLEFVIHRTHVSLIIS